MGSEMALLLSEHGVSVSLFDISPKKIRNASHKFSSEAGGKPDMNFFSGDYGPFVHSLDPGPRFILLSITYGNPVDQVLDALSPHLRQGDIILDCGNEWYKHTERRQEQSKKLGVTLIGCGISGGYQSARRGSSMFPGGDLAVLQQILPTLEELSAKDEKSGLPCVTALGLGGSGHYVKMVHNGIEQGMLGVLSEAWEMLFKCMHLPLDEISQIFGSWAKDGELVRCFLNSHVHLSNSELTARLRKITI
jgi:6-phosphogluconate dehydrogenase